MKQPSTQKITVQVKLDPSWKRRADALVASHRAASLSDLGRLAFETLIVDLEAGDNEALKDLHPSTGVGVATNDICKEDDTAGGTNSAKERAFAELIRQQNQTFTSGFDDGRERAFSDLVRQQNETFLAAFTYSGDNENEL